MNPLTLPVGTLAQPIDVLHAEDSIDRAIVFIKDSPVRSVPVVDGNRYVGVITERSLLRALGDDLDRNTACREIVEPGDTILASASGAEALRQLDETGASVLLVLNSDSEPVGTISASDLFPRQIRHPVPPLIGGMATPFGVYLTCGTARGGASHYALIATGALLAALFLSADVVVGYLRPLLPSSPLMETLLAGFTIALFLGAMRSLPLAGTHAAEHMVVHTLERGEALVSSVVKRMPRVHPRCGTNLAVGLMMFEGIRSADLGLGPDVQQVQLLLAAIISLMTFRTVGAWVQLFITTKPPTDKQVQSGIRAAEELLSNYGKTRRNKSSFGVRILNMGFLHVIAGSFLVIAVAHFLRPILNLPVSW